MFGSRKTFKSQRLLTTFNFYVAKLSIHGKVLEKHWARSCYSQPEIGICPTANEAKYNIEMVKHDQCTLGINSSRVYGQRGVDGRAAILRSF